MGTKEHERLEERLLLEDGFPQDFPVLTSEISGPNESSGLYTGDGSVDIKGQPVLKSNTGNWRACPFILGTECCERLAFYGIAANLVSYLTKTMHEGNVSAARNVSNWAGTAYLTPLIGAVLADACWGRYWTIAVFSAIYFLGMCTLTLTATVPALKPAECVDSICPPATPAQYLLFYLGLYLIALGTGGIKPCVSSFGADQFDDTDPKERAKQGSFFNWFYFSINLGALVSSILIVWIQENAGWGLGFGIPALFMGIAIVSFFSGTPLYRFQNPGGSPLTRLCQVLVASFCKWNLEVPADSILLYETPDKTSAIEGSRKLDHTNDLKCLDKAAVITDIENKNGDFSNPWRLCTVTQVEELKILIRMFPIWATGIIICAVYAQLGTLFVPVYDRVIVPIARKFTGREKGFTELQRMGIGLFISVLCMVSAALVEMKRLALAQALGLVDENVPIPLNITWQIPQYFLFGAAEVFTFIGQLEFFYEQSPDGMRSLFAALSLLTTSMGSYLSSFILTVVTSITTEGGKAGWIPDNLNEGHLDYFFWLVAALSIVNWVVFVFCATMYKPKKFSSTVSLSLDSSFVLCDIDLKLWEIAKREEGLVLIAEEVGEAVLDFSDRSQSDFDFEVLSLSISKLHREPDLVSSTSLLLSIEFAITCPGIKIGSRILLDIYGKWEMRSSEKRVSAVAISNDGLFVCFADKFGVVWFVDLDGFHENQALAGNKAAPILAHYCSIITSREFSPDGRFIISADRDFKIHVTLLPKKPLDGAHEIQSFCLDGIVLKCVLKETKKNNGVPASRSQVWMAAYMKDGTSNSDSVNEVMRDDQNWCGFAAEEIVGDDQRKLRRRRIAFRFSGAVSQRKRSLEMIRESFDDDDVSPSNSHEVHVLAVDDSLVDRKVIE
ncbi:hypothetical protein TEA_021605 [Camellia sinensis var. sinensis]|uniref:Uncharacterized protein n=1 Tax=Camellia sinensis var. sinensis TaxID=542762 RepID=A0A4S4EPR8_CAMSN|nr:hypothetical protein TEA_021605 [Camellia sinensis var. sinensis]